MSDESDKLLREIFANALELSDPLERERYLAQACGPDAKLRQMVEGLLAAHQAAGAFLRPGPTMAAGGDVRVEACGSFIGRYKLLQQIGEGGFGVVYMAEQTEPVQRKVALKIIKAGMDTRAVIARFEAEQQALALMDHPNIAKILDAGVTDAPASQPSTLNPQLQLGRPYFVMELVKGLPITAYADQYNLTTGERLHLFLQVCHGVQHAHQKGIIHRDLKPTNILVTLIDGQPVPKIIDFGVAKALGHKLTDKTLFTAFEQFIGTPAYMSPEQAALSGVDIDTRADIYALGVLLYELLTGVTPFDQETLRQAALDEVRRIIRETEPPKPSTRLHTLGARLTEVAKHRHTEPATLNRLVRGDLDWIVMKCLDKDRRRRYETASALAEDLQRHRDHQPVQARPPSTAYRTRKFIRRHRTGVALAASVAAALIMGLVVALIGFQQAREERDRALLAEAEAEKQQARAERLARQEAEQRQRAEAGEQKARAEAVKSAQVAQFLKDMLDGVGPAVARGRDTTMLQEILDKTAERVSQDLSDQPEIKAELQFTMGQVYRALAKNKQAEALNREALEFRRRLWGNESAEVAASLYALGQVFDGDRKPGKAEPFYREALAIRKKVLGDEHVEVAAALSGLASSVEARGRYEESEALWREALAMQRKLLGDEHPDTLTSLAGLGYTLARQGRLDEAERSLREALALRRKLFGTDHPDLRWSISALARVLFWQERWAEAEPLEREAVGMLRRLRGNQHALVYNHLPELGQVLLAQGKLTEAEAAFREVLAAKRDRRNRTPRPWELGLSVAGLAEVLERQGRLAEVEPMYREILDRWGDDSVTLLYLAWLATGGDSRLRNGPAAVLLAERAVALTGRTNASYLVTLAAAYAQARQFTNAVNVRKEAIALLKTDYQEYEGALNSLAWVLATSPMAAIRNGPDAVQCAEKTVTVTGRTNAGFLDTLAAAYAEVGQFTNAVNVQKEAIALLKTEEDKKDYAARLQLYESGIPYHDHGGLATEAHDLLDEGSFVEAEPLARECLALREKLIPDDRLTFHARCLLGHSLVGQKKYAEAEPLLLSGYEGMRQRGATNSAAPRKRLQETLQRLVQLYEATARPAQAAEWKQKLAEFQQPQSETNSAAPPP